jgi:hypothetical protein
VTGVTLSADGLHVSARSQRDEKLLSSALEATIGGQPVHFEAPAPQPKPHPKHPHPKHTGAKQPAPSSPAQPPLTAEDKVAKTYGKLLGHLPHVTGVVAEHAQGRIVIQVDDASSQGMLDTMIADTIHGVLVAFEAPVK